MDDKVQRAWFACQAQDTRTQTSAEAGGAKGDLATLVQMDGFAAAERVQALRS